MDRNCLLVIALVAAFSTGCADAGPGNEGSGGQGGASSSAGGGQGGGGHAGGGGGGSSAGGGSDGGGTNTSPIVINEISATGTDWIELGNPSASDVDLADLQLADADSNGDPDASNATKFASGSLVPAHSYVLVVAGENDDGKGQPQTSCLDKGGPATCFYVTWKISSSNGDGVFVLDKDDKVLTSAPYPKSAVPDGDTYGRLPDMTGPFTATAPTPGAPNQVP